MNPKNIEEQKEIVRYWLKQNDKEMVKIHREILKTMEEEYAKDKTQT